MNLRRMPKSRTARQAPIFSLIWPFGVPIGDSKLRHALCVLLGTRMKFAFFGFPHFGGTFTVYRLLRQGFATAGVELRWLGVGSTAHLGAVDPIWGLEQSFGEVVGSPEETDEHRLALALAAAVEKGDYDGVFVNVLTSRAEMSAVRYLRSDIPRVMVVHNITPGTYAAARALRDHVHATIGVSPRIRDDLVRRHRFPPDRCVAIGHGLTAAAFAETSTKSPRAGHLRLIYLGRMEEAAKGILWLPRILARLDPAATLTIAGDGPDLAALKARCAKLADRIRFLGAVPPEQVLTLLSQHDALLMPSRFEGSPLTLIEAMAAGCVPVLSRIAGVTDVIVEDGRSGFLFPIGDVNAAARAVTRLAEPDRLCAMSATARAVVRERFTVERMASRYLETMGAIRMTAPPIAPPLDPERWDLARGFRPSLRTHLPMPLKNLLRTMRERLAA
jgi:glycosyltransferase involved in cell wall biosynthesis